MLNSWNSTKKLTFALIMFMVSVLSVNDAKAGANDDPFLYKVMFDQIETRDVNGANPYILDGQYWFGYDLEKIWIKTDYEKVNGNTEQAEIQALYSRGVSSFWDFQIGLRTDLGVDSLPSNNWVVIGFQGLAPYFFEVESALFIANNGDTALRVEGEYDFLFTQKLILSPDVTANFYGQDDANARTGSGISDLEVGLRLRYEIRREIAPYIGIIWQKKFGKSADFARFVGEPVTDTQLTLGIRIWY